MTALVAIHIIWIPFNIKFKDGNLLILNYKILMENEMKQNWTLTLEIYSYSLYCSNLEENIDYDQFSSVQLLTRVMATPRLQHKRPPCPPAPRACSNSCPSSRWCDLTISSPVIPFPSCLQSFPASGSFQMSQFSHQVAKVLELQLQHHSFQWIFRTDFL